MSAERMKEYMLSQPEIYGYRIASFISFTGDSTFYVTMGKVKIDRRVLAVFNFIKRTMGYVPMIEDLTATDYLQHGYGKIENQNDPDEIEWLISNKRKRGYASISWVEF